MKSRVYKQRTNLRTYLIAFAIASIGLAMIFLQNQWGFLTSKPDIQVVVRDVGSLLFSSVAVALLWELFSRRALLAELMATTKLAEDIDSTGLIGLSSRFHGEIDWSHLLRSSNRLCIFFAYGGTWRSTHREELFQYARKRQAKATVVMPDPEDQHLMTELGRRFETTADEVAKRIREAQTDFVTIFDQDGEAVDRLSIWFCRAAPVYSYYCFNSIIIFTLYKHKPGRPREIPTFIVERGLEDIGAVRSSPRPASGLACVGSVAFWPRSAISAQ